MVQQGTRSTWTTFSLSQDFESCLQLEETKDQHSAIICHVTCILWRLTWLPWMSSSVCKSIIPGITETSSVSEMIDVLRSCFQQEVFDEVERLLISQKASEFRDLQEKNELLQEELKECRELVGQLRGTGEMVYREHVQLYRQLQSVSAELAKMKAEKESIQDAIYQNMLSQLTVLEEDDSATGQYDSAIGLAVTPLFDLNMPPQDDS